MAEVSFEREADFESERHRIYREECWIAGPDFETQYFLSCMQGVNYIRTARAVWQPAAQRFISRKSPQSDWICHSNYFTEFAVLIVKQFYRESDLGNRHPIRNERREERVVRYVVANPTMQLVDLATILKTTVKQIERNSRAMLARREYTRLNPER